MKTQATDRQWQEQINELRQQLEEANDTIHAIRTGQIDAIVVENEKGHQLYTLKTADHAYRVFIEKMKEGAVTLNKEEIIVYSNSQFASMMGLPLTRVIGLPLASFIAVGHQPFFRDLLDQGWKSDSRGELLLQDRDGHVHPYLLSLTSLDLNDGKELSIVLTDLSIQKETEKQLKLKNEELEAAQQSLAILNEGLENMVKDRTQDLMQSQEHFKFLADNIPVIVWTSDAAGNINYVNQSWFDYTGLSQVPGNQKDFAVLVHPDDHDQLMRTWDTALKTKNKFEIEYRLRNNDNGSYRWHLIYAHPSRDEDGEIVAWFGTSTDIEDQKKELQKKDEFIGIASHELKTPLTSLKGYLQLIERHPYLPHPTDQYVRKANEAITKLHHLVNDLLDVSKIQAGKLQFTLQPVDVGQLVRHCIENSEHIYDDVRITADIDQECLAEGNEERLEQVMMNLINNAVKYSRNKKQIIVTVKKDSKNVTVTVTDFGIGLSAADQEKIFERFYRVEDKTFRTSGLGMGLFISSQIIKEHHGRMEVESKLKSGSSFSFLLPLLNLS